MANSTISVTFKITDKDGSWKKVTADADGFKKIVESSLVPVGELQKKVINWTAASQALSNLQGAMSNLKGMMGEYTQAYETQIMNETRLATVMKQRMGVTDDEIQSIKNLASAQQELGVVGDEVQLAGLQQIATFVNQKGTLETLAPAMNNLIAQQKGLNATTNDAQNIGNLFGKAMQGNVAALSRVGITFSDAEANVIKFGTEEEKAAMLAQVIQNNVGNMNAELAKTDAGQQAQIANALGDTKEQIGAMLEPIAGVVAGFAQMGGMVLNITQLSTSFMAVFNALKGVVSMQGLYQVAAKACAAATAAWHGAQMLLNAVMSMNPIGIVVVAIGALVAIIAEAYKESASFRAICDKVWTATKNLASMVWDKLCKAFEWLGQKLKVVWNFVKGIFGIKNDPFTNLTSGANNASSALDDLSKKYEDLNNKNKDGKTPKITTPKATGNVYVENANTLKDMQGNVSYLEERLSKLTVGTAEYTNTVLKLADAQKKFNNAQNSKDDILKFKKEGKGVSVIPKIKLPDVSKIPNLKKTAKRIGEEIVKNATTGTSELDNLKDAFGNIGEAARNMGRAFGDGFGMMIQGISSTALMGQAIANLIKTLSSCVTPWDYIAAITVGISSTVAAFSALPFANGGVIYGKTLGLMGEYSNAPSNPEVVAPLDKLKRIIGGTSMNGDVTFRLHGQELIGCIANTNSKYGKIR